MKYEQLLKRSGSRIRRHYGRVYVCVYSGVHVTSGRRRQNPRRGGHARVPKSAKWDSRRKYVISKSRFAPKYPFLRNARRRVKYQRENETSRLHSELFRQFIITKFIPVSFFTRLFADFRRILSHDFELFSPDMELSVSD